MQENVVLCGLRNGMIVTIDTRERQEVVKRLLRHRIPCLPVDRRNSRTSSQQWYKVSSMFIGEINNRTYEVFSYDFESLNYCRLSQLC